MLVRYSSNNSGGSWWLDDEDWYALEANGWHVEWKKDLEYYKDRIDSEGRWLGALATEATKEFPTMDMAIAEWEYLTEELASDKGCHCCGQPHYFSAE